MGTVELAAVGLAGSGVGTALAIPMVWPRSARPADVRFMGGWLLAGSALIALISARVIGLLPVTTAVDHTVNLLGLCAYPLLYLCIRAQSTSPTRIRELWWLWMPAGIYLAAVVLRGTLGGGTRVPFIWMLPVLLAFTVACGVAVFRVSERPRGAVVPARFIVGFMFVLNIAQIVRMQFGHIAPVPALVPLVMTGGFVTLVGLLLWRALEAGFSPASKSTGSAEPRYEKSGLDRDAALDLLRAIETAMTTGRLFTDPNLTLGRLAAVVGSTPHQVSEVINRHAATNFHDLVNRHRVAEVKSQLADAASDRFTIEGIGAASGFGSRSALYAAFRRLEGMTPTEFKAKARAPGFSSTA